jgi:type II secretion system protein G
MKKAFTLIELLIVVSIIGILAVVLVPSITGARERAVTASVSKQVIDVKERLEAYKIDNERYPTSSGWDCLWPGAEGASADVALFINDYLNGNPPSWNTSGVTWICEPDGTDDTHIYYSSTSGNDYTLFRYHLTPFDGSIDYDLAGGQTVYYLIDQGL